MTRAIQDTYPDDFAHCFGCGRHNAAGHQFKTRLVGEETVTAYHPDTVYTGAADFTYGGLIASLIDCHSAGSAAIFWMRHNGLTPTSDPTPRFVTARLEVDYLSPTPLQFLQAIGRQEEVGERKVIVSSSVIVAGEVTAQGRAVLVKIV